MNVIVVKGTCQRVFFSALPAPEHLNLSPPPWAAIALAEAATRLKSFRVFHG